MMRIRVRRSIVGHVVLLCTALLSEAAANAQDAPAPPSVEATPTPLPEQPALPPAPAVPPPSAAGARPPQSAAPPDHDYRLQRLRERSARRERQTRRSRGLLIGGILVLGLSYVGPALTGAVVVTRCDDCGDALRMFIPIVGPLTLVHERPHGQLSFDLGAFINGLLVAASVVQSAGAVLTILGIMRYNASGRGRARHHEDQDYGRITPRLHWMATPLPGGGYAALTLHM